ncbi:LysR family transcriptional regulator [Biostraticola tofi]|uniref:DNA-binding transcriptional LysR family regulator n=1 Tax=Biostraticola tofi TaxID=466109 RepID=A0A4R3Z3Y8_9GAMM|nr:LysR family transcriptional regulator [Biostraticola tofi]TCV99876.1 DNA-binding transcriptional LysR family regulator [Biostraticola tofi]
MDIKQLIYLCNLERERHFGRAAEASFVSQPTLSMRLKNLERELGVGLIHRGNSFQGFTAEGERVLTWAREIVSVYQGLKLEVESLKQGMVGTLRIGIVPQCAISLPLLLQAAQADYPDVDYQVSTLSADALMEALINHSVDLALGFFDLSLLKELHYQAAVVPDQGIDLVFNPAHFPNLIGGSALSLEAVAELPLCLAEPSRYFRRHLDEGFRTAGLQLHCKLESASIFQLLQGVYTGLGCGMVPRGHLLHAMTPDLCFRTIALSPMKRQTAIVIAEAGRATPLAKTLFEFAGQWLLSQSEYRP